MHRLILLAGLLGACMIDQPMDSARVVEMIPPGLPVSEARQRLEKAGYRCEPRENSDFYESSTKKIYKGIDYLYCDLERGAPVSRRTQAAILYKEGRVTQVLVSTGLTGP